MASLHIANARIRTGDVARPWARALTIVDGRVTALDAAPPRAARVLDAHGAMVLPGLIDAHMHLLLGGRALRELDLSRSRSRAAFEQAVAQHHAVLREGEWLIANGWSEATLGGARPDKSWLAAAGDRPTVCWRMDLHVAVVNDAVLRMCDTMRDPPGGTIGRDAATGEPNGVMIEAAAWRLVNPLVPERTAAEKREDLFAAQRHAHALGLTTVGTMEYARTVDEVLAPHRDSLTLRCAVTLLDRDWPLDLSFARGFAADDRLRTVGCKAFIDGTLGSRTARMLQPYADDPDNRGMLVELAADGHLNEWAQAVAAAGLSPSMHAIGDEAVRLALDAIDAIPVAEREAAPPRIEHAQQIAQSDLPRFTGRIASMQPLHKADDGRFLEQRVGRERLSGTFAFRRLLDAGAHLAFGSDWPVVSCDPLAGVRAAVTGLTIDGKPFLEEQNLTVEQALAAYTHGAAAALGLPDAGVLRTGAYGDVVLLDRDPFTADWRDAPPRVAVTVAGGTVVHDER